MNIRQKTTTRRILQTLCARCGRLLPTAAATGRPRVYCGPACRKAAYEDRRARKPEAFQVRIVERTVVETVEITRTVTNVVLGVSGLARAGTLQLDGKWQPAARALAELNRAILHGVNHDRRRPGR